MTAAVLTREPAADHVARTLVVPESTETTDADRPRCAMCARPIWSTRALHRGLGGRCWDQQRRTDPTESAT